MAIDRRQSLGASNWSSSQYDIHRSSNQHPQQASESSVGDLAFQAHLLEQSIAAARLSGSMPLAMHGGFYQYPAHMMYPAWVASCMPMAPPAFAPPQQPSNNSWNGHQQLGEQAYWQHMRTRAANRKAAAGPSAAAAGTGVFLPKGQAPEEASEDAVSTASVEMHGSESDVDSLESASDFVLLDEEAPIKRGQLSPTMSIEQLLPEEWEY